MKRVRSGVIGIEGGHLRESGVNGYSWSAQTDTYSFQSVYILGFYTSSINSAFLGFRRFAFPLRCLARQYNIW